MLLDHATPKEALQKLLDMRKAALMEYLRSSDRSIKVLTGSLSHVISVIETTCRDAQNIFLRPHSADQNTSLPDGESYLEAYIQFLGQHANRSEKSNSVPQTSNNLLSGLYTEKTNVHVIFRHLPLSIQTYSPSPKADGINGKISREAVRQTVQIWWEDMVKATRKSVYTLLQLVENGMTLSNLKRSIVALIEEIEIKPKGSVGGYAFENVENRSQPDRAENWSSVRTPRYLW